MAGENQNQNQNQNQKKPQAEDVNQILAVRREKLAKLQAEGKDPFALLNLK